MTRASRRRFLGGAAAMIGLPWLEALCLEATAADARPSRLLCWYVPNGMPMEAWHDEGVLAPLADRRDDVLVVRGLVNAPAELPTAGQHAAGTAGMLTAATPVRSETHPSLGKSIDTLFAEVHGRHTPLPALALGTQDGDAVGNCDNGFSCAYSRHISWVSPTTPRDKITSPRLAFELLFAGYDPTASATALERRRSERTSVLDYVGEQTAALRGELGASDRVKLGEYLEGVREVERRVQTIPSCHADGPPELDASDLPTRIEQMIDVMVLALRCDATRAITFMLGNSASNRSFDFLGVPYGHHDLSHHQGDPEQIAGLEVIGRWEVEMFARLLARLDATDDGDGTLLEHTLALFSSELSDGNAHAHDDLPALLAGRAGIAGGTLQTDGARWGALLLGILHALDVPVARVGDADAPLAGLSSS